MSKKKLSLDALKVKSFTTIDNKSWQGYAGGGDDDKGKVSQLFLTGPLPGSASCCEEDQSPVCVGA